MGEEPLSVEAAPWLDGVPFPWLVATEAEVLEVPGRAVVPADDVPLPPLEPMPRVLEVVEEASALSVRLEEGDASGTAGGGDEGCVVPVVAGDGEVVVVAVGAVVVLVALPPVVVSAGPPPFDPVEVGAGSGEDAVDGVLDVPPPPGAGTLVEAAGTLLVMAAPGRLLVEVVVAPSAVVEEVGARGVGEGLLEVAGEPGTVLALVVGRLLVEVVVASGAVVGEVVPGGAPGKLVEVGPPEVMPVVLVTLLAPGGVDAGRTLLGLVVVVLVEVGALARLGSAQGELAGPGWVVVVRPPRTVLLVLVGRGRVVVVLVEPPAAVVVPAGATVV